MAGFHWPFRSVRSSTRFCLRAPHFHNGFNRPANDAIYPLFIFSCCNGLLTHRLVTSHGASAVRPETPACGGR